MPKTHVRSKNPRKNLTLEGKVDDLSEKIRLLPSGFMEARAAAIELSRLVEEEDVHGLSRELKARMFRYLGLGDLDIKPSFSNIVETIGFLVGLGIKDFPRLVAREPDLLSYRPGSMQQRTDYFSSLGLDQKQILQVVKAAPQLLTLTPAQMKEKVEWLESIGVPTQLIPRVITNSPAILDYKIQTLQSKADYLLGLNYHGLKPVGLLSD